MNEKFTNTNPKDSDITHKLQTIVEQTNADPQFLTELEHKLKAAHKPKANWSMPEFKKTTMAFGWVAFVILFGLALSWSIRNLVPTQQPGAKSSPTPTIFSNTPTHTITPTTSPAPITQQGDGYNWRSTKLYLSVPLPAAPAEAQVYSLKLNQPSTREDVLALAQRFGIQGEVQESPPDFSNNLGYTLTDGTQRLEVQPNNYFFFTQTTQLPPSEQFLKNRHRQPSITS